MNYGGYSICLCVCLVHFMPASHLSKVYTYIHSKEYNVTDRYQLNECERTRPLIFHDDSTDDCSLLTVQCTRFNVYTIRYTHGTVK